MMGNNKEIEEISTIEALELVHGEYIKVRQENEQLTNELKTYKDQGQFTQKDFEKLS